MRVAGALVAALLLLGGPAAGQPAPERPWVAGVPEERQVEARRIFDEGNLLFEQEKYAQALAIYRDAVKIWDHPSIRYNMAVANIHLDQPLAAYEDLAGALRYGPGPLKTDAYKQALTYQKLLLGQLGQLKVVCREPEVSVFLDGEQVLVGPGETTRVLAPGKHQLVASKPDFITASRAVTLVAGVGVEEVLQPVPMPREVRLERRFPTWAPWTVAAAGAGLIVLGVPFQLAAGANLDDYQQQVAAACPAGCPRDQIPAATRDLESRAHVQNGVAIGLFATGAVALGGGLVMVFLNQPHPVEPGRLTVAPASVGGRAGLVVGGRF